MQGGRDPFSNFGNPFGSFSGSGGFGGQRSLLSGFFGGRDPFDDPFFTRPFGGMFGSTPFGPSGGPFMDSHMAGFLEQQPSVPFQQPSVPFQQPRSRGPVIEELDSDDEKEEKDISEEKKQNMRKHARPSTDPFVEYPDDEAGERKRKQVVAQNDFRRANNEQQPQVRSFSFQSSTMSYGGANGTYYSSSKTRRTGSDGLTFEESKEANSATGQASHRVSRGIHNKGHSLSRKLDSDGRVDTMQTLHNLNENELDGFEETWKGKAGNQLPGLYGGFNLQGDTDSVTVNFARSGGPGGQNVNKVNTKVDMRFNVKNAYWLSDRVREKILQMEKNRINKDGELVISSTKTRTQKGNIEDALSKLQAIIEAASYVPPPPSEEQVKKINKMAAIGERKRLDNKKAQSQKKAMRRSRDSYD